MAYLEELYCKKFKRLLHYIASIALFNDAILWECVLSMSLVISGNVSWCRTTTSMMMTSCVR